MDGEGRARVLIVEDDALTALNVKETLEERGHSVLVARTGEEAARLAEDTPSIDLVFMDIELGSGMDGIETASLIARTNPRPVIFTSARSDDDVFKRLEAVPSLGFVPKGASNAAFAAAVAMALRKIAQERAERERIEADVARRLQESAIRIREAHHRVRNNIASIRSIMSLQLDASECPETVGALQDAIGRIEGMATLHELLALGDVVETGPCGPRIPVQPYIEELVGAILPLFPVADKVAFKRRVPDFKLDPKRLFALGIIVNELLTNAMKYAFKGRDGGAIDLDVKVYDESIVMVLRDDGNGLPDSFDPERSGGLGISLITMLLEQFGGTLSMRSDHGTTSTVLIKAPGLPSPDQAERSEPKKTSAVA